ncbi:hypothetical protein HHI36_005799 [Cryptolaemus montrouzieri]|uniref:Endonuclease/exonuclease/phosphatase domain-containing protein n=1 Tax=Cryptolaemus montrouzieri TaxID=559131 RepID=A0ABD2NW29_9CUCU
MSDTSNSKITCAQLNVQSLLPNFSEFRDDLKRCDIDVVGLTETLLNRDPSDSVLIEGYNFIRNDQVTGRGETGIYIKNNLKFQSIKIDLKLENTTIMINIGNEKIFLRYLETTKN